MNPYDQFASFSMPFILFVLLSNSVRTVTEVSPLGAFFESFLADDGEGFIVVHITDCLCDGRDCL